MKSKIESTELLDYIEIYNKYEYLIEKYIMKICPCYINDEDFIQDAKLGLLEYIEHSEAFKRLTNSSLRYNYVSKYMYRYIETLYKKYISNKKSLNIDDFEENLALCYIYDDNSDIVNTINMILNTIPEIEAKYLKMYYLDGLSMSKIAELEGCKSIEIIRRNLAKGLKHLRHPQNSNLLRIYIED